MAATSKTKKTRQDFSGAITTAIQGKQDQEVSPSASAPKPTRAAKTRKIILAIPEDMLTDIDTAAWLFFSGNRTAYINDLIVKDIEANGDKYKSLKELISNR